MNQLSTFVTTSGRGDNILCLHSCLGSSRKWGALTSRLQDSYRVTATDLFGFGKAPAWNYDKAFRLENEVGLLASLLDSMSGPGHLVGHSYGAAVALKVAQTYPHKIASVIVYEPVLFTLLIAGGQVHPVASEIFQLIEAMREDYESDDSTMAVRRFIEYWSGGGSWNQFSADQQSGMASKTAMVLANFEALMSEQNTLTLLEELNIPTLCLYGESSPVTTARIAHILAEASPVVNLKCLPGLGHMGPITHSANVKDQIETFLHNQKKPLYQSGYAQAA